METSYNVTYLQKNDDFWLTEDERNDLKIKYRIKEVVFEQKSTFQHVMILDSYQFGRMLVLDGVVQTTSKDGFIYNEMISHVPLAIHPHPKKVLIIGGGDCGAAKEVCKYENVEQIDLVEIDEVVVQACKKHLPEVSSNLSDPRVNFIYEDGVKFLEQRTNEYDIVIVDSSDPVGPAQVLFEESFYTNINKALKDDGLMVCQSQSPFFHQDIMRQTYKRISNVFAYTKPYIAVVPTYPGGFWSFTIGSKKYTDLGNPSLMDKQTKYVNDKILHSCFSLPQFINEFLK